MRLATILPRASLDPVPVASLPDGTWMELAALVGRPVTRIEESLTWVMAHFDRLVERAQAWKGPRYRQSEFTFLPPVPRPVAFRDFDAFEAHVRACRDRLGLPLPSEWFDAPAFHFANRLAIVGHGASVTAPTDSCELDFGLAIGVVIGRRGRDIPVSGAWDHVAGLTVINDLCARDLERKAFPSGMGPSKGKDFATAAGPWLTLLPVFRDLMQGERIRLSMTARINGRKICSGNSITLHHSIPRLVAQASRDADLFPGDLLSTGAVGGGSLFECGANGTGWLSPGDRIELEIERIGSLETHVISKESLLESQFALWRADC